MNSNTSFRFFSDASDAAKGSMNPFTKVSAFRKLSYSINEALRKDWTEKENEKAELRNTFVPKVAQEKGEALDSVFADSVKVKQIFLNETLEKLVSNIQRTIDKFAMIPPSAEKILLIENAEKRMTSMTEKEFMLLISSCADNYQESALLQSIAQKHGKDYNIPFEPEEATENLNKLKVLLKEKVIDNIDKDPVDALEMATFFRFEDGKPVYGINTLAEYFDNLPIAVDDENPIPELTNQKAMQDNLLKARQTCWNNNAKALWEEAVSVNSEIQRKGLTSENITKAERIIKIVDELFPSEEC